MADFTALKTAIQTYIKQNGNEEITGDILQEILLSVVTTLGDGAINDLITALGNEATARQQADGTLQQNITNEATARGNADTALQGLINGVKNNVDNGYVYAGIATPSTTPVSGKVFYLALTAGTYANFDSAEVSQGINILKYKGSAWSLDAFIGIDDTPTPNSPKLVKSGGVFESVMSNGSAFDISAHFASGGTLATYADLTAALTALNTLSADYKRGGMSMKYVQTSDNKYVQYRYLKATVTAFDFTQTYNWQGVDDKPVAGYDESNLVKSVGVGNKIMLLNIVSDSTIQKAYKLKANASYHIRNNSTSTVTISRRVEYNGTVYDIVNVVGKATIVYTPTGDGNYLCAGSACNLDVCPVDSIIDKVAFAEEYSDNVPTTNSKNVVKSGGVKTAIDEVVVKIDNVANVESPLQALDGYINTSTSTLDETVITGNFAHYIGNCVEGDRFIITGRGGERPLLWSFWDSNNQIISKSNYNVEATNLELTAPENAAKVVFNSSKSVVFSFNQLVPETQQEQDIKIEEISNSVRRIRETINVRNLTYPADAYTSLDKTFKRGSRINISANFNNVGEDVYFTILDKDGNTLGYRYKSAANFSKEIIATFEIANIIIYFPSTVTSGTKMSNIKIEVLTDVVIYDELNSQFLSSGNYQFGLKGDGAYHCPSIPALPQQSETNCAYFYALYDALVAQHPNYITKVDCDAEMVAQGYTRPSELSNLPIYMYKFIPKYAPSVFSENYKTQKSRLKVYIVTGTHPEYMSIYDTYQTMRLICEQWENDANLQELRWNAEFYIIPCSGPYGINQGSRTNYNGVDLNRNAPSNDWRLAGYGTDDYSGPEPASEYETKLMMYYFEQIKPNIFIDHHNMDSVSKVLIWPSCRYPFGVDVAASLIADMTAAWKKRSQTQDEDFAGVFPSNNDDDTTMFGVAQYGDDPGMRSSYASDNGAIGFTYESQASISYANGEFDASHRQTRTKLCCTCATEGFINFLYRLLKSYSIRFDA